MGKTGLAFRLEVVAPHLPRVRFHLIWDGQGESAESWKIVSSDGTVDRVLSPESFDELLGKVFLPKPMLDPLGAL